MKKMSQFNTKFATFFDGQKIMMENQASMIEKYTSEQVGYLFLTSIHFIIAYSMLLAQNSPLKVKHVPQSST